MVSAACVSSWPWESGLGFFFRTLKNIAAYLVFCLCVLLRHRCNVLRNRRSRHRYRHRRFSLSFFLAFSLSLYRSFAHALLSSVLCFTKRRYRPEAFFDGRYFWSFFLFFRSFSVFQL